LNEGLGTYLQPSFRDDYKKKAVKFKKMAILESFTFHFSARPNNKNNLLACNEEEPKTKMKKNQKTKSIIIRRL